MVAGQDSALTCTAALSPERPVNGWRDAGGCVALRWVLPVRQHAAQDGIALGQVVVQGRTDFQRDQYKENPVEHLRMYIAWLETSARPAGHKRRP